jgi:osmotically inducible lipoprotein OsmB
MKGMQMRNLALCLMVAPALLGGCSSSPTRQQIGTATGAVVGGVVGAVVTGGSTVGTVAGAAAGGVVGAELAKKY